MLRECGDLRFPCVVGAVRAVVQDERITSTCCLVVHPEARRKLRYWHAARPLQPRLGTADYDALASAPASSITGDGLYGGRIVWPPSRTSSRPLTCSASSEASQTS